MIRLAQRLVLVPFLLATINYITRSVKSKRFEKKIWLFDLSFILYCSALVALLFFPLTINLDGEYTPPLYYNIIPLYHTIKSIFISSRSVIYNIFLTSVNLFLFVPLAAYLVVRFPKMQKRNLVIIVAASCSAEFVQLALIPLVGYQDRVIDIDDLILNGVGGVLSFFLIKSSAGLPSQKET
jgi:glycopeptide antibiotics resistance protein